ncbi:MAG: branched-chain amino acid ABC transporter permease [Candidatus Methanomethylicota archaeon]|uniref:Branched-chain amino acid ABC transporter permease n=1 Tax=Thermoproteota archaeon TaxID=2056631 RepID=A0A497EQ07_9CREN|nr:MAG: branched-chain amino acid ABC transporter permease [Candidatus Verstraetearchaeota archaeon]
MTEVRHLMVFAPLIALAILPFTGSTYITYLTLISLTYVPVVLGFNLLLGYTGLLSFGHGLFLALGMYVAAFMTFKYGILNMELILLTSIVISAIVALGVGFVCVKYTRIFFAMLTLAFGMIFYTFLLKFYYITGGDEGLPVLRPTLLGISFADMPIMDFLLKVYYYYVLIVVALTTYVMYRIVSSHFGLCLKVIRDNPLKAEHLGINVKRYRLYAFVISGVFTAIGGALLAPAVGHVDPGSSYWTTSGDIVFMTLLGGFTNFFGPIIGAFAFIFLKDIIMSAIIYWQLVFGIVLLVIVIAVPGGLVEGITRMANFIISRQLITKSGTSVSGKYAD